MAEDQCVWARIGGRTFDQDRTWTNIGGDVEAWNISAGAQALTHQGPTLARSRAPNMSVN
jgi:hypothetical protein